MKEKQNRKVKKEEICPYADQCGGCAYQGMAYEEQLAKKQELVTELVGKFGKVEPIKGMAYPYHYRNKVHAAFGQKKNGQIICGTYEADSHWIIDIEDCMIEDKISTAIIRDIKGLLPSFKIRPFHENTGRGLFRHVLIRRGFATGEVMVVLVLTSPVLPSKNNFVKALLKLHPEITTIVMNINDKHTSMILGEQEKVLYGKGYIVDELMGCKFRISAKSFYQVNPVQTKALYQKAISLAHLTGNEFVLDAYCGIGTIGLIASKNAGRVMAVELNPDAVRDGITNAKMNQIDNVRFIKRDATEYMLEAARREEEFDVVFMDPPRAGSTKAFVDSVIALDPERVVYISCNPQTLARDLEWFRDDYKVDYIQPFDMFPFAGHVETVCLLSRKALV